MKLAQLAQIDFSTLNLERITAHKVYRHPATHHLSDSMGQGCYGDAPGFPSYFLRSVYTQSGNTPRGASSVNTVITLADGQSYVLRRNNDHLYQESGQDYWKGRHEWLASYWTPLPYDHPRVQAWIKHQYKQTAHCYRNPALPGNDRNATVIYPVSAFWLKTVTPPDPRYAAFLSPEWYAQEQAQVDAVNEAIVAAAQAVAVPENHTGYLSIVQFYPEHTPSLEYIENPPQVEANNRWWEVGGVRP